MSESYFQTQVLAYLRKCGAWAVNIHGNEFQSGCPDILACYKGKFLALELKAVSGKASKLQERNVLKIRTAGGIAYIVYSMNAVKGILSEIDQSCQVS